MFSIRLAGLIAFCISIAVASQSTANPEVRDQRDSAPPPVFAPEKAVVAADGTIYGISEERGFTVSTDGGASWELRDAGLPRKVIFPFAAEQSLRPLTSVGVDPVDPARVAVTTPGDLYVSEDAGRTWSRVSTVAEGERKPGTPGWVSYLTAVALSPSNHDGFLIGTSFDGFYETTDRGRTWTDPSSKARFLDRGAHFFEEVAGISYDPSQPGVITIGLDFGYGIYRSSANRETYTDLAFPGAAAGENIRVLRYDASGELHVVTDSAVWQYGAAGWQRLAAAARQAPRRDPAREARIARAANRTGIYVSSFTAGRARFDELLAWVKMQGLNSVVIDFKDDDGILAYDSALEMPKALGVVRRRFDARQVIDRAHQAGVYVIARILVFKDRAMYGYRDGAYAVWDRERNAPWRNLVKREDENKNVTWQQVEFWVDPYSEAVWDYNIAVAKEAEQLGVDEIQFDYIRFPTDGDLSTIVYRSRKPGQIHSDALESFLAKARESLSVPISTDLYGFNSWYHMGNWNGQSIDLVSRYADAICPMYYPSHFPADFLRALPYIDRARRIYQEGTTRSSSMVAGRSVIRPYVQAFRLYGELKMTPEEYTRYLRVQLEGAAAARASGFTLWNASNDYYMASFPLAEFLPPPAGGAGGRSERGRGRRSGRGSCCG